MSKRAFYEKYVQSSVNVNQSSILASLLAVSPMNTSSDYLKAFYENALKKATKEASLKKKNLDTLDSQEEQTLADVESIQTAPEFLAVDSISSPMDLTADQDTSITLTNNKTDDSETVPMWWLPLAVMGGYAIRGDGNSTASPVVSDDEGCDLTPLTEFVAPTRPSSTSSLNISLDRGESLIQSGGMEILNENQSLLVTLADHAQLYGSAGSDSPFTLSVDLGFDMGDIYISAGAESYVQLDIDAYGSVGDVTLITDSDTREYDGSDNFNPLDDNTYLDFYSAQVYVEVAALGDIGNIYRITSGSEAGGFLDIDALGGNVAGIETLHGGVSGEAIWTRVSAFNNGSGYGGNIGDINVRNIGIEASGIVFARAYGGDIADVSFSTVGASAAGEVYVEAIEESHFGSSYGGAIGDISVKSVGASAEADVWAVAHDYIGDIRVNVAGYSADGDVFALLTNLSGGQVGDINIQVGCENETIDGGSGDGGVRIFGNSTTSIGDVTMSVFGGLDYSAAIQFGSNYDGSGFVGSVGDITFEASSGSVSAQSRIEIFSDIESGSGMIGDILIDDHGFAGDHEVALCANHVSGMVINLGAGSANVRVSVATADDVSANIGNIAITMDDQHYGSGGYFRGFFGDGTEVGTLSIEGGSEQSQFRVVVGSGATGAFNLDNYGDTEHYSMSNLEDRNDSVMGDVDMSRFNGFSVVTLDPVLNGVEIKLGSGGSNVRGTRGADDIYLGAGEDAVYFDYFNSQDASDTLFDFDLTDDKLLTSASIELTNIWYSEQDSPSVSADFDSLVLLVDEAGGQDLSTEEGLELALSAGGEYQDLLFYNDMYIIATASASDSTTFNLYEVWFNLGTPYANLMGVVNLTTGDVFSELSLSNFNYVI